MSDRIGVFIPAYNCEKQVGRVLAQFDDRVQACIEHVRVFNNSSKDDTLKSALAAVRNIKGCKVSVVTNKVNYNLGGTIKLAMEWAIQEGFDYLICLHGDDQPDIRDLLPDLQSRRYRDYAVLAGARFHPDSRIKGYSLVRILGNRFFNILCSVIFRRPIYDLIAGLNIFKVQDARSRFWTEFPNDLTFDVHFLFYCMKNGMKVGYSPISWREEDQVSNAKTFRQGMRILRLIAFYIFAPHRLFDTKHPLPAEPGYNLEYSS